MYDMGAHFIMAKKPTAHGAPQAATSTQSKFSRRLPNRIPLSIPAGPEHAFSYIYNCRGEWKLLNPEVSEEIQHLISKTPGNANFGYRYYTKLGKGTRAVTVSTKSWSVFVKVVDNARKRTVNVGKLSDDVVKMIKEGWEK